VIAGRMREDQQTDFLVRRAPYGREHLIRRPYVGIEHDDALGRHHEGGVAGTFRMLQHIDVVGDAHELHPRLRGADGRCRECGKHNAERGR
jgi:hypothetical protein